MSSAATSVEEISELLPEKIQCPLCSGEGEITRAEVLQRLGMRDFARVAQLSAEEAMRLLLNQEKQSDATRWAKFETELVKRLTDVKDKHSAELQKLQTEKNEIALRLKEFDKNTATVLHNAKEQERLATEKQLQEQFTKLNGRIAELEAAQKLAKTEKETAVNQVKTELQAALNIEKAKSNDLDRQLKDFRDELSKVKEKNQQLEGEMSKVARQGKREEIDFAEDVASWPGVWIGDKLSQHGDYLLAYRDGAGSPLDPMMVVDNKDKATITEPDIKKLIRDCHHRSLTVGVIVTKDETQLRQADRNCRWGREDGIWLLRSTRAWLQRDLEVLKPIFERMRAEGPDFLSKNAALAAEVRHTFVDLDEIERELGKAGKAIDKAKTATSNYHLRLAGLCDTAAASRKEPSRSNGEAVTVRVDAGD